MVFYYKGAENVADLFSCQEEADTRMILHAVHADTMYKSTNSKGRVTIKSADTDVLVLAIHYQSQMTHVNEFWLETGHAMALRNNHRFIPIHTLCKLLSPKFQQILPAVHALTGCDSTSSFFGIGKKSVLKVIEANDDDMFQDLTKLAGESESEALTAASKLVTRLYKGKADSIDALRYQQAKKRDISLAKLPPCEAVLKQHVKRAMWQTRVWMSSHIAMPSLGSPVDFGWTRAGDCLNPLYFEGPTAAELLKDMVCSCRGKTRCASGCACHQSGLSCTDICTCHADNEQCGNALTQRDFSDDEDSEDDNDDDNDDNE